MPWSKSTPMDQKTQFIADYLRNTYTITELCQRYGISRKTGYKWIERYIKEGPPGLQDHRRTPKRSPNRTPQKIVDALLDLRTKHPSWGAKKLLAKVGERHPSWNLPARSTVYQLLEPYGVIQKKRRTRKVGHPGKSQRMAHAPNDIWCADFKGHFRLGNGQYCYPLTITDQYSRFLIACQSLPSTELTGVKPVFSRVFKEFGMPKYIRTDNGTPFASNSLGRLSRLSVWYIQLGVLPDLIEPGKPQQNGRHERMHRTLKDEATKPPGHSLRAQQRKFNVFQEEFNQDRPHEALGMATPASVYEPSSRPMPSKTEHFEYPDHYEVRYVSTNACVRWNNTYLSISRTCIHQYVGFEHVDHELWDVWLGPIKLGRFHEKKHIIEDQYGRLRR